jgi:hypothetical protein
VSIFLSIARSPDFTFAVSRLLKPSTNFLTIKRFVSLGYFMAKKSALTLWFAGEELLTGKIETSFRQITATPKDFRPVQIAAGNKHLLVLEGKYF